MLIGTSYCVFCPDTVLNIYTNLYFVWQMLDLMKSRREFLQCFEIDFLEKLYNKYERIQDLRGAK